ncbi:hypothetical protein Q5H80_18955 [Vibrio sp. SNU_ST1]|nr:hypothetical protein [Vibrio sp. SNU_ST1]WKY60739.1 hypothetical protein Q5H80_18955 [Vibrio sp. SNU_ST1]
MSGPAVWGTELSEYNDNKKTRIKHAYEFKVEALKLADKVGVAAATRQLSLYEP